MNDMPMFDDPIETTPAPPKKPKPRPTRKRRGRPAKKAAKRMLPPPAGASLTDILIKTAEIKMILGALKRDEKLAILKYLEKTL